MRDFCWHLRLTRRGLLRPTPEWGPYEVKPGDCFSGFRKRKDDMREVGLRLAFFPSNVFFTLALGSWEFFFVYYYKRLLL